MADGEVGVGGTEADGGCDESWHGEEGSDLAADAASGEVSGSGLDRVACRGFGTTFGLAGSVCVLLSASEKGSLSGASELGVEIRGPERLGMGSGDGQGLVLGDWDRSGDRGGTQNFRTGWSHENRWKNKGQRSTSRSTNKEEHIKQTSRSRGQANRREAGETCAGRIPKNKKDKQN